LKFIPTDKNISILDAGCGNGRRALKLFHLNYTKISAVDLFDSIPVKEINYFKASIEDLPFNNNEFEFVYAMSVIYYPTDPGKAIKEFERVLKPGGTLIITAHTKYSLFTLKRIFMRLLKRKNVQHLKDVRFKSANEYIGLLKRSNFEINLIDGFNLSFIFVPAYNLFKAALAKYTKINLPFFPQRITKSKAIARLKSIFAYHMIIVARKK
jgi:ubiquinone/menaquinone biosynthesis C-methylase UbiE